MTPSGEELADAMEAVTGTHPGYRRAHAIGIVATAMFTPTLAAASLSGATALRGPPVPATVRFSNGSGIPTNRDDARDGRGIAVKLQPPGGPSWDLIAISLPQFFVRTAEDFMGLMAARVPDPETGELDMDKVGAFLGAHPEALPALGAAMSESIPASYAQIRYHGLHTFLYVSDDGARQPVRHEWSPAAGEASVDEDDPDRPADHLRAELGERLAGGPVAFTLRLHLGTDEDDLDDPTVRWPDERTIVEAGRLELTALAEDQAEADALIFDPTNVPDGVECSADEILHARSVAYGVSYARRTAGD